MTESGPPATDPAADPAARATPAAPNETRAAAPAEGAVEPPEHEAGADPEEEQGPAPSWWHSSHPTFAGLVGFFTGVAFVIVVPGIYAALLSLLFSDATAQRLFPLVALIIVVPLVLLIPRKTRRFAQFMLLGTVATAVVIGLTAALVIWVLVQLGG
jgi:hypothetical protein